MTPVPTHTQRLATLSAAVVLIGLASVPASAQTRTSVFLPVTHPEASIRLEARWHPSMPAEIVLPPAGGSVSMQLDNPEVRYVTVRISARAEEDGVVRRVFGTEIVLRPSEKRDVSMPLSFPGATNLKFSGKLVAEAFVRAVNARQGITVVLPNLYFHPATDGIRVYRASVLRSRYGAGNFRQTPAPIEASRQELGRAMLAAALPPGTRPTIARVSFARSFGVADDFMVAQRRFCLSMPGEAFYDSSNRVHDTNETGFGQSGGGGSNLVDYGEDFGRAGQLVPMSRGWVVVSQGGNSLYTGHLDAAGCTPLTFGAANTATTMAFSPLYRHTGSNLRGFVSDVNLGAAWPATMPLFLFNFQSAAGLTTHVTANSEEYTQTIYAAAARGMERFPGGSTNVLYEWQLGLEDDPANAGTATNWATDGYPRVHVKHSTAARSKFTMVHEYGHAILMARVGLSFNEADLDYGADDQHSLDSKEWQLAAALEGFAHFVAAVTWNDTAVNADGVYVSGSAENPTQNEARDLNTFGQHFLTQYGVAGNVGQGVEMDWAQFFWNYHTDTPGPAGVLAPSGPALVAMFDACYSWPKNEGFYADFASGASAVMPSLVGPPANVPLGMVHFSAKAAAAGIIN